MDALHQDQTNPELQLYELKCKNIEEGTYSIILNTSFVDIDRYPCKFKINVTADGIQQQFNGIYKIVEKMGERHQVVEGLPIIKVQRQNKNYSVSLVPNSNSSGFFE